MTRQNHVLWNLLKYIKFYIVNIKWPLYLLFAFWYHRNFKFSVSRFYGSTTTNKLLFCNWSIIAILYWTFVYSKFWVMIINLTRLKGCIFFYKKPTLYASALYQPHYRWFGPWVQHFRVIVHESKLLFNLFIQRPLMSFGWFTY